MESRGRGQAALLGAADSRLLEGRSLSTGSARAHPAHNVQS
jgi:hypothetical protein